jgi:Domain of Unknown Function (DUF930)
VRGFATVSAAAHPPQIDRFLAIGSEARSSHLPPVSPEPPPTETETPPPVRPRALLGGLTGLRRPGLAVSAAIHVLLLVAAILLLPQPSPNRAPEPESIEVELLTEPTPEAPPVEAPPARIEPSALPVPPPEPPPPAMPKLVHANRILSGGALNAEERAALGTLRRDARFEQLCDVEAMEQIAESAPAFKPEQTIAYLTADTEVHGDTLTASGAAFLSQGHWYRLAFKCRTTADRRKVVSFDFATGAQVPDDDPRLPAGDKD